MDLSNIPDQLIRDEIWVAKNGADECIVEGECSECPFHPDCLTSAAPGWGRQDRIDEYVSKLEAELASRHVSNLHERGGDR